MNGNLISPCPSRFRNALGKYKVVRSSACVACGKCVEVCAWGVYQKAEKRMLEPRSYRCNGPEGCRAKESYCVDNCPMDAIDFSVTPPQFDKDCDFCWLCEQTCPRGAIEVDYKTLDEYHKPLNKSVLQKSIDVFEAKGLFRRLVPDEDIGWDTSFYLNKKPRFKIDY